MNDKWLYGQRQHMLWWIGHQRELKEIQSAVHSLRRAEECLAQCLAHRKVWIKTTPVKVKTGTKSSTEGNMNKFCEMFIDLSKQDIMPWQKHFAKKIFFRSHKSSYKKSRKLKRNTPAARETFGEQGIVLTHHRSCSDVQGRKPWEQWGFGLDPDQKTQ